MATCKLGEKGCWKDGKCHYSQDCENKVITNADRIRAMSDEELGKFIQTIKTRAALCQAVKNNDAFNELCSVEWLKQPLE